MALLTAGQIRRIKEIRGEKAFTVLRSVLQPTEDIYDEPTTDLPAVVCSGNWIWRDFLDIRSSVGGVSNQAELLLVTDIENEALLMQSGTRIKVEGIECALTGLSHFELTGRLIVKATQVMT